MAGFSRTWWGKRFIEALEEFTDSDRLARGRSYASGGRILSHEITGGTVQANVRGSINPYFGVYKEPTYLTTVAMKSISRADWTKVIADLASKAGFVAKLLLNEMPDTIETAFTPHGVELLPHRPQDFTTSCTCPDYYNPCKHIAGVCYLLSSILDRDPFLMFELRGLSRDDLRAELVQSPLGEILASELTPRDVPIQPAASYFTRPTKQSAPVEVTYQEFWGGVRRLPPPIDRDSTPSVPALTIKKQGDYPPFWQKDRSFIEVMEEVYERVRTKSPQLK